MCKNYAISQKTCTVSTPLTARILIYARNSYSWALPKSQKIKLLASRGDINVRHLFRTLCGENMRWERFRNCGMLHADSLHSIRGRQMNVIMSRLQLDANLCRDFIRSTRTEDDNFFAIWIVFPNQCITKEA